MLMILTAVDHTMKSNILSISEAYSRNQSIKLQASMLVWGFQKVGDPAHRAQILQQPELFTRECFYCVGQVCKCDLGFKV